MSENILNAFNKLTAVPGLVEKVPKLIYRAALLIPIQVNDEDWQNNVVNLKSWRIYLTMRSESLKRHAGEMSFPGGRIDNGETPLQTAFRELDEEIGIKKHDIISHIQLNNSYARSGFHIVPFCGLLNKIPDFKIHEREVSRVVSFSVEELLNIKSTTERKFLPQLSLTKPFSKRIVWHYPVTIAGVGEVDIWGATGNILRDLLARFEYLLLNQI